MLEQGKTGPLKTYAFLLAIEVQEASLASDLEYLKDKLGDALSRIEGFVAACRPLK